MSGRVRPLVCRETVDELIRVLAYPKFHLTPDEREQLLADYLPFGEPVRFGARAVSVPACRDPADEPFLRLAIEGRARFLVTGDHDLLAVGRAGSTRIVTIAEFLAALAESS